MTNKGINDTIRKGIGRAKLAIFKFVPKIIRNGRVIKYDTNWKDRGYDTAVICAPVMIGNVKHVAFIVVRRFHNGDNNFYLHEVEVTEVLKNKVKGLRSGLTTSGQVDPSLDFIDSVAEIIYRHNPENVSQVVDENGETEARNASTRRTQLTAEERAAIPPWETEDVKEDEQIVRFEVVASFSAKRKGRLPSNDRYNAGADNAGAVTGSRGLHELTPKNVAPIREFAMSISKSGAKSPANFMRGLISALGSKEKNVDKSQYFGISTPDGKFVSLRIANHRASAKNYRNKGVTTDDNLSLVVKMSEKSFQPHRGVRLTELVYFSDKLTAEREVSIANAVAALIDGDDIAFPEADQINVSPHGIDDGIKFSFSGDSLGIATLEDAKVADAEYKAVVARYTNPDGSKKSGWMKAPNGKPTNLTERQWVQVRTPAFKRWFGDWEAAAEVYAIIDVPNAPFNNVSAAIQWVKNNGVIGLMTDEETGGKGEINISVSSIREMLNPRQREKSVSIDAHFAALTKLREIIRESRMIENHPDYKKGVDGTRSKENGANPDVDINILYGAMSFGGEIYRIKTRIKRYKQSSEASKAYSYHVSAIEVLPGTLEEAKSHTLPTGKTSITGNRLLQDVRDVNGNLIIDYSKVVDKNGEPLVVYHGSSWNPLSEEDGKAVFMHGKIRNTSEGVGFYFTPDKELAEGWGEAGGYFLNLRNAVDAYSSPNLLSRDEMDDIYESDDFDDAEGAISQIKKERHRRAKDKIRQVLDLLRDKGYEFYGQIEKEYVDTIDASTVESLLDDADVIAGYIVDDYDEEIFKSDLRKAESDVFGIDGYVSKGYGGSGAFIAFSPTQIKSATDNIGTFNQENPDIRHSMSADALPSDYDAYWRDAGAMRSTIERAKNGVYDRIINEQGALFRAIKRVMNGKVPEDEMNVEAASKNVHGKIRARSEMIHKYYIDPLRKLIKEEKLDVDKLDDYLYAKFAPERNAMIAARTVVVNPNTGELEEMVEDGSGMSNAEAKQIMNRFNSDPKRAAYDKAMHLVWQMNAATANAYVKYGFVTKEQRNKWSKLSPHYVPLKDLDSQHFDLKHAKGRSTKAASPLAASIWQASEVIKNGEFNIISPPKNLRRKNSTCV